MNEKLWFSFKISVFAFIAITFTCFILGGAAGYGISGVIFDSKDQQDNRGIESYRPRERELLERIGEYEQRERERIARENSRIERERSRIEQTEKRLGAIRELNRRTGDLLESLAMEAGCLQDYFYNSRREYLDAVNNSVGEVK